ncbi:energy-coupling factor transporter transmembrane protein EcfT [Candidatus Poribacteria bacterium]|nr:energy-coupling factor transporter transmembrane protein EcfT [Candidatus Poribacteria bacterium]
MARLKTYKESLLRQPTGHAYQFRATDSPIHRLGAGWKVAIGCLLSVAAFAAREPWVLAGLLLLNAFYYFLARLKLADFWRDTRFFAVQMIIIVSLYLLRFGVADGLWPGARTALQILLFFVPGVVLLRTTQTREMAQGLRRVLSPRMSFVVFSSLRFVPFFARELREITMAQRLRGAPLNFPRCIYPWNWKDVFHCLAIPLIVRALKTAHDAALSAEARGFGRQTSCESRVPGRLLPQRQENSSSNAEKSPF